MTLIIEVEMAQSEEREIIMSVLLEKGMSIWLLGQRAVIKSVKMKDDKEEAFKWYCKAIEWINFAEGYNMQPKDVRKNFEEYWEKEE